MMARESPIATRARRVRRWRPKQIRFQMPRQRRRPTKTQTRLRSLMALQSHWWRSRPRTKRKQVMKPRKPSSTVKADTEAAEETDKDTDETEIADGSTEPLVEVEAENEEEAGDEAKEADVAEANTNDA